MSQGNGKGAILDLRAARRQLAQARAKQKLDLLLDSPALVRRLPPEELYLALLEIGPDEAADIVAMATPEQFRHFVDMAAWGRSDEGPSPSEVARWLGLAREGEGGAASFQRKLAALDLELLALLLRRELQVHELTEDDQPSPANPGMAFYTSDRRFLLEFTGSAELATMRRLIEDLYQHDAFAAGRLIESIRWEVPTELEETARRWREGRLRDLGVPAFEEAIAFYARPARREAPSPPADPSQALTTRPGLLLDEALALLSGEELDRAEEAVVHAANAALVANRVPLTDGDQVRTQLADARATLSLGLELLSSGDPARAARLLSEKSVREIFQAAMGEAYALQSRARKLAASARLPQAQSATLLDEPVESALQALLQQRPQLHEPGQRQRRAFASRADLLLASALLDEGEATVALAAQLGLSPAELGPLAEKAGVGPAVLKWSGALRALAEARLRGAPLSLEGLAVQGAAPPEGLPRKLDDLLATAGREPPARRAVERLKALALRTG